MIKRLLHFLGLCALASSANAVDVTVVPDCAGPEVPVGIIVSTRERTPLLEGSNVVVARTGSSIKVLIDTAADTNPSETHTLSTRQVSFGKLPVGTYDVTVFFRTPSQPPTESTLGGTTHLNVSVAGSGEAACTPAVLTVTNGAQQEEWGGEQPPLRKFPKTMEVLVTDAQGRPVPNTPLSIVYWPEPGREPGPAATFDPPSLVTDAAGVARFNATANDVAGPVQYAVQAQRGAYILRTYVALRNRGSNQPLDPWSTPMVGYWSQERGHYFMTADPAEMAILDAKPPEEWIRYNIFTVSKPGGGLPNRSSGVCRFYGLPEKGLDSHFFAADQRECDEVIARFSDSWVLETREAFRAFRTYQIQPNVCFDANIPLYRVFNNRPDVNHIYTTSRSARDLYVSQGYIPEGYGPDSVQMCVPQ